MRGCVVAAWAAAAVFLCKLTLIRSDDAAQWPCPGACWLTEDSGASAVVLRLREAWDPSACPYCNDPPRPPCDYGQAVQFEPDGVTYIGCLPCISDRLQAAHRLFPPTRLSNCSTEQQPTMCERHYHTDPDAPSPNTAPCLACLQVSVQCPPGYFPKQCITSLADGWPDYCTECALPRLLNRSVHAYGPGFTFTDCARDEQQPGRTPHLATCAYFQTPKWGQGYCSVHCQPGFAQSSTAVAMELPQCTPCATDCPAGFRPPVCPGGAVVVSAACQPCDPALLPTNAVWTRQCAWACRGVGFYGVGGECIACPAPNSWYTAQCDPQTERWLGCGGATPGGCRPCRVHACNNNGTATYLRAEAHMAECECAPCARPRPGGVAEYVAKNCSALADAVLRPCSNCSSSLMAAGYSYYRAAACGVFADTRCARCTTPADAAAQGRLQIAPCRADADAVYVACPETYACNGSALPRRCDAPRVAAAGLCVCPPATRANARGVCVPIACPHGAYPDAALGGCRNCTLLLPTTSVGMVRTLPGMLGFDACACRAGFLRRVTYAEQPLLACWPCGDLGCAAGVERQAPRCDGARAEEPRCECGLGPGMALASSFSSASAAVAVSPCAAVQCAPGYEPSASPAAAAASSSSSTPPLFLLTPGLHDTVSFVSFVGGATVRPLTWTSTTATDTNSSSRRRCRSLRRAVTLGGDALLAVCGDDGSVWVVRTSTGRAGLLDLSIFEIEGVRTAGSIRGRELLPHGDTPGGFVWFLFGFWGLCGHLLDTGTLGPCSGFELLLAEVDKTSSDINKRDPRMCAVGVCLLQGTALWGNYFAGRATVGTVFAATWAPRAGSPDGRLYFFFVRPPPAMTTALLFLARYDIVLYAPSAEGRPDDPVRVLALPPPLRRLFTPDTVGGLAVAMGGLYIGLLASASAEEEASSSSSLLLWRLACPGTAADDASAAWPLADDADAAAEAAAAAVGARCTAAPLLSLPAFGNASSSSGSPTAAAAAAAQQQEQRCYRGSGGGIKDVFALPRAGATAHVLWVQDRHGGFCTLDLLNGFVSRPHNLSWVLSSSSSSLVLLDDDEDEEDGGSGGGVWAPGGLLRPESTTTTTTQPQPQQQMGMLVGLNQRAVVVQWEANVCGVDTFALYTTADADINTEQQQLQTRGGCMTAQCLRAEPCGPHSRRRAGVADCECAPGYALLLLDGGSSSSGSSSTTKERRCAPCADVVAASAATSSAAAADIIMAFYCPGGRAPPAPCPAHSLIINHNNNQPPTSAHDCQCVPGYFMFQGVCVRCPTSLWCPFNGTVAPIQCHGGGFTYVDGGASPTDCVCPRRTHGLRCTPCDDSVECSTTRAGSLASLSVEGWGPAWGGEVIDACLLAAVADNADAENDAVRRERFLLYPALGVSRRSLDNAARQSTSSLAWAWIVVVLDVADPWALADALHRCLSLQFTAMRVAVLTRPVTKRLPQAVSCGGRHWEWGGGAATTTAADTAAGEGCVCVAGYEEVVTETFGRQCFPCPNGTHRPRRRAGGCTWCSAERFERTTGGGYLGMAQCDCIEGYTRDAAAAADDDASSAPCQPTARKADGALEPPEWYRRITGALRGDPPTLVLLLSISGAAAALVFTVVLACVF